MKNKESKAFYVILMVALFGAIQALMQNFPGPLMFLNMILVMVFAEKLFSQHQEIKEFKAKDEKPPRVIFLEDILNVNLFNIWFNEPKDKSIYAHPGIFLRTDKLDGGHIDDYIKYKHGVDPDTIDGRLKMNFESSIRKDWMDKLKM